MSRIKDRTGQEYGFWTVLYRDKTKLIGPYWMIKCTCGTEKSILSGKLVLYIATASCQKCRDLNKIIYNLLNIPKSRNIKWTEKFLPLTSTEKVEWKCLVCKHIWEVRYNDVIHRNRGCPKCSKHLMITEEQYYILAKEHGFKWLGKKVPKNVATKTKWQCKECTHKWKTTYSNIYHNLSKCPKCNNRSPYRKGYVYLALGYGDKLDGAYKIGHARNPERRNGSVKHEYPVDRTEILCTIKTSNMRKLEKEGLHPRYKDYRIEGEREWFRLPEREVGYIKMLAERELVEAEDIGRL